MSTSPRRRFLRIALPLPALMAAAAAALAPSPSAALGGSSARSEPSPDEATATLEVFPYASSRRSLRCTAFHLGEGLMATAGHCFLGLRECNGARVIFNSHARRPFPRSHACLRIEAIAADVMREGSQGLDLALFRISDPPRAALRIGDASTLPPDAALLSVEGLVGHRDPRRRSGLVTCAGAAPWPTDFFGRPRPRAVLRTSCAHGGFAHGAPLLDPSTGDVVGLVTGVFRLPTPRSSFSTAFSPFSGPSDAARFVTSEGGEPTVIRVGSFSTEAFPRGLEDRLDARAVRFVGPGAVTLSFQAGASTEIEVRGADGSRRTFAGAPSFSDASAIAFPAPVEVRIRTLPGATGVAATIRRH